MNALNIRDIGAERKAALEARAREKGVSVAELVRSLIDRELGDTPEVRQAAWIEEAQPGIEAAKQRLQRDGPSLPEFRMRWFTEEDL